MENSRFQNKKDEELLAQKDIDHEVSEYLLEKYKYMVRALANQYYLVGADKEDLVQEGMIGLFKAIRDFRAEKGSSFYSFASLCINRELQTAITRSQSKKNSPLNNYVSISANDDAGKAETEHAHLIDTLEAQDASNPEQAAIDKEFLMQFENEASSCLSELEYQVMRLLLDGNGYREIAEQLCVSPKSVDNAIQRCKQKLLRILK